MAENKVIKPEIIVFAGPNGSGKSTITESVPKRSVYINADDIKRNENCSDLEAAQIAEKRREQALKRKDDFMFETVLSTSRNIELLKRAKELGYFIKGYYVLTVHPDINVERVKMRVSLGGHDVPEEKIISRYYRALELLPEFVKLCDVCHIYDNSEELVRIFKKRKEKIFYFQNPSWDFDEIESLTQMKSNTQQ